MCGIYHIMWENIIINTDKYIYVHIYRYRGQFTTNIFYRQTWIRPCDSSYWLVIYAILKVRL